MRSFIGAIITIASLAAAMIIPGSTTQAQQGQTAHPTGTFTPGHTLRSNTSSGSPYSDGGGAAGSAQQGVGYLSEIGVTAPGLPVCINDRLISDPQGYHRLCLGHDDDGVAVIVVDSIGGASTGGLDCIINGVRQTCLGGGTVVYNDTRTEAVSAAGQDQTHATVLGTTIREHFVLGGTGGVALPPCGSTPTIHDITNMSGAPVRVYPTGGGTDTILLNGGIPLAANIPLQLDTHATLVCRASGQWTAATGPRLIGAGPIDIRNTGAALQASINKASLTAMLQQLGYQPGEAMFATPFLWTPADVSGDGLTFPGPSCGGSGASCTVCTVDGLLTHVTADIVWPTNSGTHAPNISGVPIYCMPSATWAAHDVVGSINCPGSVVSALNIIVSMASASNGLPPDTPNGKGTITMRTTTSAITNATLSGKQCMMNFTFPRNKT